MPAASHGCCHRRCRRLPPASPNTRRHSRNTNHPQVKKKFIDKKNATTYSLVFRSTEDVDDVPERVLVDADKRLGPGRVDAGVAAAAAAADEAAAAGRRFPPGHPLAWLHEEPQAPVSEERRRELIELGFPGGWLGGWRCGL